MTLLSNKLGQEGGLAIPITMMLLSITGLLLTAAALTARVANSQSGRDVAQRRAAAAVDAAIDTAVYRFSKFQPADDKCVSSSGGTLVNNTSLATDLWCPIETGKTIDNAAYSYRVSRAEQLAPGCQSGVTRKIVAIGEDRGVRSRVVTSIQSEGAGPEFRCAVVAKDVFVKGSGYLWGDVLASRTFNLQPGMNSVFCGDATTRDARPADRPSGTAPLCAGAEWPVDAIADPVFSEIELPLADHNGRIDCAPSPVRADPATSPTDIEWDCVDRTLRLRGSSTLTLTGNKYSFCSLKIENDARLIVAPRATGTPVEIFIDEPGACPNDPVRKVVKVIDRGVIENTNDDPSSLRFYIKGGTASNEQTSMSFERDPSAARVALPMVVSAPHSTVWIRGPINVIGAAKAETLKLGLNAEAGNDVWFSWSNDVLAVQASEPSPYVKTRWVQCTSPASTTQASIIAGCDE